jgi:predicted O-linked N-acetylglucosamine transferase (SPINDLY family)
MNKNAKLIEQIKADFRNDKRQQAIELCEKSSYLDPKNIELKKLLGLMHATLGNLSVAQRMYEQAYALVNDDQDLIFNLGILARRLNQYESAKNWFEKLLQRNEQSADTWACLGECQFQLKMYEQAVISCDKALAINSSIPEIWNNKGKALNGLKKNVQARDCLEKAVELAPSNTLFVYNLAELYAEVKNFDQAIELFEKVTHLNPSYYQAWLNLGICHILNNHFRASIPYLENAIQLNPQNPLAHIRLSLALLNIGEKNLAQQHISRAILLNPNLSDAWNAQIDIHPEEDLSNKVKASEKIEKLDPDYFGNLGVLCHSKLKLGMWDGIEKIKSQIRNHEIDVARKFGPFDFSSLLDDPQQQLKVAQSYMQRLCEHVSHAQLEISKPKQKIKVAYISPDYHEHPVTYLITELIETHSRDQFEIYGFSLKERPNSQAKERIVKAFDHFIDISQLSIKESVSLIRSHDIDIAVDLCGFTADGKPEIFGHRVAPIQMSYIGYLGSMGSTCYDYLIADKTLIPEQSQSYYAEKIIYLPTYQVNDSKRARPEKPANIKEQMGLPQNSIVFASFNSQFKYNPEVFDSWIRILQKVPQAVLYLLSNDEIAEKNFKEYFQKNHIDSSRIFFTRRVNKELYLQNYHGVDIFLDTWPYNAGTTASDALWMGVPVLTKIGQAFQARMAASILEALKLPELIAHKVEAYEALAVKLATDHGYRVSIAQQLKNNMKDSILFDINHFRNSIEQAYQLIYERKRNSQPLEHVEISNPQ